MNAFDQSASSSSLAQFATFYINGEMFGIEVMRVQEVASSPQVFNVPMAPEFVGGLVNLRGQIATALVLRKLFGLKEKSCESQMSVVCKMDGNLMSLIVDSIGDVIGVSGEQFEMPPDTIPQQMRRYIKGVYKLKEQLMSVIDLDLLASELSPSADIASISGS